MMMCLCYGVSCYEIKKIVQSGIVTTEGVQQKCFAGTGCGCCLEALTQMVELEVKNNQKENISIDSSHVIVGQGSSRNQFP